MWTRLLTAMVALSGVSARSAEPSFYASFDHGTAADNAAGSPAGKTSGDLALHDGLLGKAVAVGVARGQEFSCTYDGAGNISSERGTVSLWLKPLDWGGSDPNFQVFLSASGENGVMHIYRYQDVGAQSAHSRKLLFLFGPAKRNEAGEWQWTIASSARARGWGTTTWHHVACTWDAESLKLYLDGRLEDRKRVRAHPAAAFDRFAVGGFGSWQNAGGTTLVDELRVHRSPLSPAQVYTEWEARSGRRGDAGKEEDGSFAVEYVYTDSDGTTVHLGLRQPYPIWSGKAVTARVRLVGEDGRTAAEHPFSEELSSYEVGLDAAALPTGTYELQVAFIGVGDVVLAELREAYRKYPPGPAPWDGNGIGVSDKAPAPWTPVEVSEGTAACWGREYRFDGGAFPRRIVSQGTQMLRSPVSLSAVINGEEASLRERTMTWEQTSGAAATFQAQGALGSLGVRSTGTVEFDGFVWLSFVLEPVGPTRVSKLVVDLPLRKECATLRNLGQYRLAGTGAAPREGSYRKDLAERPIFWLGNEDVGLQWFAEGLDNWCVTDFSRSLEVSVEGEAVVARLNIIDTPTVLNGPTEIAFGLQATPVRPRPRAWRTWRLRPWRSPGLAYTIRPWFTEWTTLFNYPEPSHVVEGKIAELRKAERDGLRVLNYVSLACTTRHSTEQRYYGERWRQTPQPRLQPTSSFDPRTRRWAYYTICPNARSYRDFYLGLLHQAVREHKLTGGLYFDQAVPYLCANTTHGCSWRDAKGEEHKTFNILGTRELAKRIYVMMKEYSPDAVIAHHMSGEVTMPVNAFSDIMIDGENLTGRVGQDESYYGALPLDTFRAEYMPRQWGSIPALLPQHARAASIFKTRSDTYWYTAPEAHKPIEHLLGLVLVHDALIWPAWEVRPDALWRAQDEFGWDDAVTFLPYWESHECVRVLAPESDNVVVSVFRRPGKAMLVPFNNTDTDVALRLGITPAKLGLVVTDGIRLRDAYHGGEFVARDGVADVPVPARGFRMLVTPAKGGSVLP